MPRIRITIVMPTEITSSTELWTSRVARLPWVRNTPRVCGSTARTAHSSTSTPAMIQMLESPARSGARALRSSFTEGLLRHDGCNRSDRQLHDLDRRDVCVGKLACGLTFAQHDHAIRESHDLRQIRRREHDGVAARRELLDERVDLRLRADVDAAGRLVEQQH